MTDELKPYEGPYAGFINFLLKRKELHANLVLVKNTRLHKLYATDVHPSGMSFKWYYDYDADANLIASTVDIPLETTSKI